MSANTDADIDHDPDSDLDADLDVTPDTPACSAKMRFGRYIGSSYHPSESGGVAFFDLTGNGLDEMIVAGNDFSAEGGVNGIGIFSINNNGSPHSFSSSKKILFPLDEVVSIGAMDMGNLDHQEQSEIILFLTLGEKEKSPGQLRIIYDAYSPERTSEMIDVDVPLTFGALVNLDGDIFRDIAALSWEETSAGGQLLVWQRMTDAVPEEPVAVHVLNERPDKLISFNATGEKRDEHELVISFPEDQSIGLLTYHLDTQSFTQPDTISFGTPPIDMTVADLDPQNDFPDVIVAIGEGGLYRVEVSRSPTFSEPVFINDDYAFLAVTTADIDGDEDIDVLAHDGKFLVLFCNEDGELFYHDEIPHNMGPSDHAILSAVRIDATSQFEPPDVVINSYSLFTYYNE